MLSYFSIEDEFVSFQKERFIQLFVIQNMFKRFIETCTNMYKVQVIMISFPYKVQIPTTWQEDFM